MKLVVVLQILAACAYAFPSETQELDARADTHPWIPVQSGGVRAPCPGINTLANHGYLPRNGKNVTAHDIQLAFFNGFNFAFDTTAVGVANTVALCKNQTGGKCDTFDLDILNVPHAIEHDASLSRQDFEMKTNHKANNHAFNQTMWDKTLTVYGDNRWVGVQLANTARLKRYAEAQQMDVKGWFIPNDGETTTENAFFIALMRDPKLGNPLTEPNSNPRARLEWLNYWMKYQRKPTALGWAKPTDTVHKTQIQSLAAKVSAAPTVTADQGKSPYVTHPARRDLLRRELENLQYEEKRAPALANVLPDAYNEELTPEQWGLLPSRVHEAKAAAGVGPP